MNIYARAPIAIIMPLAKFRARLDRLANSARDRIFYRAAAYKAGYRQALKDAGVDVFHVRSRIGGSR